MGTSHFGGKTMNFLYYYRNNNLLGLEICRYTFFIGFWCFIIGKKTKMHGWKRLLSINVDGCGGWRNILYIRGFIDF